MLTVKCKYLPESKKKFFFKISYLYGYSIAITLIITSIDTMDEREIFELTGCTPGCEKSEFDLTTMQETPKADQKLSIYLTYLHGEYDLTEEYYIYDHISFIADIGGYLGLLLGYSLLSMYHNLVNCVRNYRFERYLPRPERIIKHKCQGEIKLG